MTDQNGAGRPLTGRRSGRPGPPPQTVKRERYVQLMNQGMNNSEACRILDINRRTGTRWWHGRAVTTEHGDVLHYPPVVPLADTADEGPSRYLSQAERVMIADARRAGDTVRAIGERLGRSPSTISRELNRNRDPATGAYTPGAAQRLAAERRPRPKVRKLQTDTDLRAHVQAKLELRWSPEQISRRLPLEFPDRPLMRIAPETIYQTLYDPRQTGLQRGLTRRLRTGRTCRRRRPDPARRRNRFVDSMVMIDQRPDDAEDRGTPGHWEGDLIVGAHNRSAIGTLVERASRFTILVPMGARSSAQEFADNLTATFDDLPEVLKRSLAWDQGTEMACHTDFQLRSGVPVFFCQPHSPWQRGTNENTNGLLRQYFPKGTDLAVHDHEHLAAVANELNARPRKTLGWHTPAERLTTVSKHPHVATTP